MIDLRSDTVTRPTPAMLTAMLNAKVGDDVYGEDPTCNLLEETVAKLLGKEAAIYTPTGTMANQIAIQLHTQAGESIICEEQSHFWLYEAGAAGALAHVQIDCIPHERMRPEFLKNYFREDNLHSAPTRLFVLENTHNRLGGLARNQHQVEELCTAAKKLNLATHCDGARLWNAAAAVGCSEAELAKNFDTVAVCFSKGLGAPVGSALAGSKKHIDRARKLRKRLGGGMRQAGILAQACLHALQYHRELLHKDHIRAKYFRDVLTKMDAFQVIDCAFPTNMVYFRSTFFPASIVIEKLKAQNILVSAVDSQTIRAVFHFQINDDNLDALVNAVKVIGIGN